MKDRTQYWREYSKTHRAHRREYQRAWREANREKVNTYQREWSARRNGTETRPARISTQNGPAKTPPASLREGSLLDRFLAYRKVVLNP